HALLVDEVDDGGGVRVRGRDGGQRERDACDQEGKCFLHRCRLLLLGRARAMRPRCDGGRIDRIRSKSRDRGGLAGFQARASRRDKRKPMIPRTAPPTIGWYGGAAGVFAATSRIAYRAPAESMRPPRGTATKAQPSPLRNAIINTRSARTATASAPPAIPRINARMRIWTSLGTSVQSLPRATR